MTDVSDVVGVDFRRSESPGRSLWITEGTATAVDNVQIEGLVSTLEKPRPSNSRYPKERPGEFGGDLQYDYLACPIARYTVN